MAWTLADVPDLSGKVVLVTGATSGVGLEAARIFVQRGAKLIMACRNATKMAAVATQFLAEYPTADIIQLRIDLSDLDTVHQFVAAFKAINISHLDILLLNAGLLQTTSTPSAQGYNAMFAANHLGHWLLTGLLLDFFRNVPEARVVVVSSVGHRLVGDIDYTAASSASSAGSYHMMYSATKLANQWFVESLKRRLRQVGSSTIVVACHPGYSATALDREMMVSWAAHLFKRLLSPVRQDAKDGAMCLVMAATDPLLTEDMDCYYGPDGFLGLTGKPTREAYRNPAVKDEEKAEKLWAVSEEMTGFKYPF